MKRTGEHQRYTLLPHSLLHYIYANKARYKSQALLTEKATAEQTALESLIKFDLPLQPLAKFEDDVNDSEQTAILFSLDDYITLVDYTALCSPR